MTADCQKLELDPQKGKNRIYLGEEMQQYFALNKKASNTSELIFIPHFNLIIYLLLPPPRFILTFNRSEM